MKYQANIQDVCALNPDYIGFIFYSKSKRFYTGDLPKVPEGIHKVGVFVNASLAEIQQKVVDFDLDHIQLHGEETAGICASLQSTFKGAVKIIKAFNVDESFAFESLNAYVPFVDYFLFDAKGKERGGNGITFNWQLLHNYRLQTPYFLSGGIGLDQVVSLREIQSSIAVVDVNSAFETKPGLKQIENLGEFITNIKSWN